MTLLLPDTSEFQFGPTAPDWAGIKAKNGGAGIVRVGYGDAHLDHMFVNNYTSMKGHGFKFMGLYQYLVAGQDPAPQAAAFCNWVGPPSAIAPGTVFILDLEEGGGDQSGRANTWFDKVDTFYGLKSKPLNERSWLYSYTSFVASHNLGGIFASNRHTWVAAYQSSPPALGHTLWQSTDGKTGANITNWPGCGRCDTSVYDGTLAALAATGWQADTPPDPPSHPQPDQEHENMIGASTKTTAISFGSGSYTWIAFFADPSVEGKPAQQIRVAPFTTDQGFSGITSITVSEGTKVTVALPAHCAGISLQRSGSDPDGTLWCPVAWNLG